MKITNSALKDQIFKLENPLKGSGTSCKNQYKRTLMNFCLLLSLINLLGCSTWQEPQIDGEKVEIFLPRDSLVTDIATQLFYWYHVDGALKYELQIVSPTFGQIDRLLLDTNVSGNKFEFTLSPGSYEWSIRAYNGSSSTAYTISKLFIDSTLNLGNQSIVLMSPPDRDTSNRSLYQFEWQDLYNAETYHFELFQPNVSGQLLYSEDTQSNTLDHNINMEGAFEWRVKALNSGSQTIYSYREFYRDVTSPLPPVLQLPDHKAFITTPDVTFQWNRDVGGSSLKDSLYLTLDSTFATIHGKFHAINESLLIDTLADGTYYWRVRSFDKAGNTGAWSGTRQFIKQ